MAIIMDGNGRWARMRGKERIYGHMNGVESVRSAVKSAVRNGVRYLTLYAFSTENWGRPKEEIDSLMELFCQCIIEEAPELIEQGVSVEVIGDREQLSTTVNDHIGRIESQTAGGENLTLILAINYSSRSEIVRAVRNIAEKGLAPDQITEEAVERELYTAKYPDPDFLIRTSGEQRLSNFLMWQLSYAELYFTPVLWPDFRDEDFDRAIEAYAGRDRRYGLITEQR